MQPILSLELQIIIQIDKSVSWCREELERLDEVIVYSEREKSENQGVSENIHINQTTQHLFVIRKFHKTASRWL